MPERNFIGGAWRDPIEGAYDDVVNPATGAVGWQAPASSAADVDAAVAAAKAAYGPWAAMTPRTRSEVLHQVAQRIEDNIDELSRIECENVGKPVSIVEFEMDLTMDNWRFFASAGRFLEGKAAGEYLDGYTSVSSDRSRRGTIHSTWRHGSSDLRLRQGTRWSSNRANSPR